MEKHKHIAFPACCTCIHNNKINAQSHLHKLNQAQKKSEYKAISCSNSLPHSKVHRNITVIKNKNCNCTDNTTHYNVFLKAGSKGPILKLKI